MQNTKSKVLAITYVALFAALIAICAFITIPIPGVPFTMQTFGVFAALCILGGRLGTSSVAVYILMGAVGIPVFSGFRGGISVLLGPTGGYIAGFIAAALIYWLMTAKANTLKTKIIGMTLGMIACYALGTVWFVVATGTGFAGIIPALLKCVVPFIIPDALKCAAALWVSSRIKLNI